MWRFFLLKNKAAAPGIPLWYHLPIPPFTVTLPLNFFL